MVAATATFIRSAGQVSLSQPLDLLGANGTLLPLGPTLFLLGSSIEGNRSQKGRFVMIEDVRLGSADIGAITQEEFPN
jgi:hypothetical protein